MYIFYLLKDDIDNKDSGFHLKLSGNLDFRS